MLAPMKGLAYVNSTNLPHVHPLGLHSVSSSDNTNSIVWVWLVRW